VRSVKKSDRHFAYCLRNPECPPALIGAERVLDARTIDEVFAEN